jgi:hypothetical protein
VKEWCNTKGQLPQTSFFFDPAYKTGEKPPANAATALRNSDTAFINFYRDNAKFPRLKIKREKQFYCSEVHRST